MTVEMFKAIVDKADCKTKNNESTLPEGRTLTLYVAHEGVAMTITKLVALRLTEDILEAQDQKGELFVVSLSDVFGASIAGGTADSPGRRAGFLG